MTRKIAELAQSVERTTLNRVVKGSIPLFGVIFWSELRGTRIREVVLLPKLYC
jgi:hypothetical protein